MRVIKRVEEIMKKATKKCEVHDMRSVVGIEKGEKRRSERW